MNPPAKRKRIGGIQKGYVYPKTKLFRQALDDRGFLVPDKLIELFNSIQGDDSKDIYLKLEILKEMNKYSYPVPRDYTEEEKPIDLTEKLKDIPTEDLVRVFSVNNDED